MSDKKLAIIIPIYNVENYLRECLDSILSQSYTNFIALLIDDGSMDNSLKIAQEYCNKDSRFKLLAQSNQGSGMARNHGLDFIFQNEGEVEYIGFVDSDDVISIDFYRNLIYALESSNALVAKSRDITTFNDKSYNKNIFLIRQPKRKGRTFHITPKNESKLGKIEVWRGVYKRELLSTLRFPNVRYSEDVPFGICINALAQRVVMCRNARYFYRQRASSLMKTSYSKQSLRDGFSFLCHFFATHNLMSKWAISPSFILSCIDATPPLQHADSTSKEPILEFQEFIKSQGIRKEILYQNKTLKILLDSKSLSEFERKTQSFREWRKKNFRIDIRKNKINIHLFGFTLLDIKRY